MIRNKRNLIYFIIQTIIFLNFFSICTAQTQDDFGQKWIKADQKYYKIPVAQTGMYAVTFSQLHNAGVPTAFTDAHENLQLFHRGIEQAIHISNDTLVFYGQRNDGTLDSILYEFNMQPHKYYNLYSDTTAYFLTWSSNTLGNRMELVDLIDQSSSQAPEAYHYAEVFLLYNTSYDSGFLYGEETWISQGDKGEGWFGGGISSNGVSTQILNLSSVFNSPDVSANLEIMLVGRNGINASNNIHFIDILIGNPLSPDFTFTVSPFAYHDVIKYNCQIPSTYLTNGALKVTIRNKGNGVNPSIISLAYIKFNYPQTFNMFGTSSLNISTVQSNSVSNIEVLNTSNDVTVFDISNKNDLNIVKHVFKGDTLKAGVSNSFVGHKLYICKPTAYLSIPSIKKVDLTLYRNNSADYIIITNTKILNGARDYAKYRASNIGGGYDTLVAEIDRLYNLHSYGERTPVAIRKFVEYLYSNSAPKYLFIIGKALSVNYPSPNGGVFYRLNPSAYINNTNTDQQREDLVPTYGMPGSDLPFVMNLLGKGKHEAAIAIGRLPAKSNKEILDYLNKVQEHDTTRNALWRKNLIHLVGGNTDLEKTTFLNYMTNLKGIVEDTVFGGDVLKTYIKNGNKPVDDGLTQSLATELNKGVSYVTFFGHASPGIIDLDIGYVSYEHFGYDNKNGRYPMLYINGCSFVNIYTRWSASEDWILTPKKGAILILGHAGAGYQTSLYNYAELFYKNAFKNRKLVNKPVGDIQLKTIEEFNKNYGIHDGSPLNAIEIIQLQQMMLQGDPAVRMYTPDVPDYETNNNKVSIKSFDNNKITAVSDSFAISIVVSNLGVDFGDSLNISVRRTLGGREIYFGTKSFKNVKYQDTLLFVIKSKDASTYGLNTFIITLDPLDSIPEIEDVFNNTATLEYFIPVSGVTALFPKEFSIVNSNPVTLIGQATNLLRDNQDYYMEIDTSYLFNSPVKQTNIINAGSLVKWENFSLPVLQDSLVYYWRIRYNDVEIGEDPIWAQSSFVYINNSPKGWSQSEFPQFFKDPVSRLTRDTTNRKWEFSQSKSSVEIRVVGTQFVHSDINLNAPWKNTYVNINGFVYINRFYQPPYYYECGNNILFAIAFDKNTTKPYSPYPSSDGFTCGVVNASTVNKFINLQDSIAPEGSGQNQANLMAYIERVQEGDVVIFGNSGNASFSKWSQTLKNKIRENFGAKYLDSLKDGMPYILVARKGDLKPIYEVYSNNSTTASISFDSERDGKIYGKNNTGLITSTLIGPAESWGTFYRAVTTPDASDNYQMKIIGVNIEGKNVDTLTIPQQDSLDLNTITALNQYPYIRLLAEVEDVDKLTPPQLKRWQVIYNSVPEGTMNPALIGLDKYNSVITKQEGDSISVCYAFENISKYDFTDTLQVKYTITNSSTGVKSSIEKLSGLKQDSVLVFCHKFSTKGFVGSNVLRAYVNPKILKEEYYNNNIIESSFNVTKDNTHPILDVVFDGVHIMDGDIVSPNPMITITLNDENKYLIRNSTNNIEVFIQYGNEIPQAVIQGNEIVSAKQVGVNGKNVYQIEYNPKNLKDGNYTLIVRAKDMSENSSGVQDYKITFEVINESTISNFYPYPNPFSTSTRFVFTLTGSEIPQDMKIQIMTVTGKVVREIMKDELGHIRIGNNKTDFAWDGTDEFGDKLANGVYLYRVILKNDSDFKHRKTAGDKAFKKEFGKLYILR